MADGAVESGLGGWLWEERANVVALLGLLATVGFGLLSCLFFYAPWLEGQLARNPTLCERKARQLMQPRWVTLYQGWLVAALDRLDRWMGPLGAWGQGFKWCLAAGLAYSFGFLLLAWVGGVPAKLGELTILSDPAQLPFTRRLLAAALIIGAGSLGYLALRSGDHIEAWFEDMFVVLLPNMVNRKQCRRAASWARRGLIGTLLFATLHFAFGLSFWPAVAVAGVVAAAGVAVGAATGAAAGAVAGAMTIAAAAGATVGAVTGAAAAAAAGAVAVAAAGATAVAVAVAAAGAVTVAAATAVIMAFVDRAFAISFATSVLLFGFLLPFLNAIFDWVSWLASRWLGRDLAARLNAGEAGGWRRLGAFAWHVGWDLVIAVGTLVGLAWSIPRVIGLLNTGLHSLGLPTPLALDDYLCRSALNPLGQGLWASLMLFSTLVPTAIHLAFLLAAPFAWLLSRGEVWQARARHFLGDGPPPPADLPTRPRAAAVTAPGPGPHPETLRQVALHFALVRPLLLCATGVLAVLLIGVVLWAAFASWEPLPRFLLLVATSDSTAVAACFSGG